MRFKSHNNYQYRILRRNRKMMEERYLSNRERVEELETLYPDVDWYGILIEEGRDSLESYAEWYKENYL